MTVIPWVPASIASACIMPSRPALDAEYAPVPCHAERLLIDEMKIIRPPLPCSIMAGRIDFVIR